MARRSWWWNVVAAFLVNTVCFSLIGPVEAGDWCYTSGAATYCRTGCCGSSNNEYCCNDAVLWIVIGSVLGGLFLISVIVVIVCYVIKKKGKPGRVIQPAGQAVPANVTVVYTGTSTQYPGPPPPYGAQPMGAQPMAPPPYGQYATAQQGPNAPPFAALYSDPAYNTPNGYGKA